MDSVGSYLLRENVNALSWVCVMKWNDKKLVLSCWVVGGSVAFIAHCRLHLYVHSMSFISENPSLTLVVFGTGHVH
jgi:hypothetical protein